MSGELRRQASMAAPSLHRAQSVQVSDLEQNRKFMDLYSRQIGAFGLEAMLKLTSMRVLLVGLRGVGIEVAKNTILAGVHSLTLYDPTPTQIRDLGSNFFLTEMDVGKPRGLVCAPKLAELNHNVKVENYEGEFNEDFVKQFDAVVFTQGDKSSLIKWNEFCRSQTKPVLDDHGYQTKKPTPIAFISCFTAGACGTVFSDFGPGFIMRDSDGAEPFAKIVVGLEQREEKHVDGGVEVTDYYTLVRYLTPVGQVPGSILDGTMVSFSEIEGMFSRTDAARSKYGISVNTSGSWRCWHPDGDPVNTVRIGDTRAFSAYITGGMMTQVKEAKPLAFRPLGECLIYPSSTDCGVIQNPDAEYGFALIDMMSAFSSGGLEQQLHIAVQAVMNFELSHGRPPAPNNDADTEACVALAHEFNRATGLINAFAPGSGKKAIHVDELNEACVRRVARMSTLDLQPMCAFFGGVIAQELVKLSGKFRPLNQFLNMQAFDALPASVPADTAPLGSRYDDQIAIYGKAFQEKLGNLKLFMVGCGALGCEYSKNFALTGACCGPLGMLTITDNDRIEVSNLNRQFLFREENVGQPKSVTAAERAKAMNSSLRVTCHEQLLVPATEHIFTDDFWLGLDVVCNALDNIEARLYSDSKCVFYHKPLMESATMGTGANVDVVVPGLTKSYGEGGRAGEQGGIPMCTLRNFPHLIEHCIEWSRSMFEDLFVSPVRQAAVFLEDPAAFLAKERATTLGLQHGSDRTNAIANSLGKLRALERSVRQACASPSIKDCVAMAFETFHQIFRDRIIDLTTRFPENTKLQSGEAFWSGHKKFPKALTFNPQDTQHVDFVIATANLYAGVLKVHPPKYPSEQNDPSHRWMAEFRDRKWAVKLISALPVPAYTKGAVANLEEDMATTGVVDDSLPEKELEQLLLSLESLAQCPQNRGLAPADFEKDDDDNFHIDFVAAAANLRACNYHINPAPRHKCKMIAGRIIPAVATTTAAVTGLVMLELYKVLQGKPLEAYRNGFFDIGSNTYTMFEPSPPSRIASKTVKSFDDVNFDKQLKAFQSQSQKAEGRVAELKQLIAGLSSVTSATEALEPVQAALAEAEQAVSELSPPQEEHFMEEIEVRAYPNPHTLWDQIAVPSTVSTMRGMADFFAKTHNIKMSEWAVKSATGEGRSIYPVKQPIAMELMPSFELASNKAFVAIQTNPKIREKQRYFDKWKELKSLGAEAIAAAVDAPVPMISDDDLPLSELLQARAGIDLSKRRRLLLDGLTLVDGEGEPLETAKVVLHLA